MKRTELTIGAKFIINKEVERGVAHVYVYTQFFEYEPGGPLCNAIRTTDGHRMNIDAEEEITELRI